MSTNMRSVLKVSIALRNLCSTSNRALSLRLLHSSSGLEARFNRPVLASDPGRFQRALDDIEQPEHPRTIAQQLRDCQLPEEVLLLINKESSRLTGHQALKFLASLFGMAKKSPSEALADQIRQKKEFATLCDILKKHIRQLTPTQAIEALKHLIYFHVPSTTVIINMLLQMVRTSVNQLSLDELVFLSFLLKKCQTTPLIEALGIALPMIFETQVMTQLDRENLESLVRILQYLRQSGMSSEAVPRILNIIEKTPPEKITPAQAKQILFCLLDWDFNETVKLLIPRMMEILAEGMEEVNPAELHALLRRISKNFSEAKTDHEVYYHDGFADACGAAVVSRNLGFERALEVADFYHVVEHVNIALLDYMAAKCFEDKSILTNANKYQISSFLHSLSRADYKPVFWDSVKESLMSEKLLDQNVGWLLKPALWMASLDCYWPKLIAKIFTEFEIRGERYTSAMKRILLLYHTVKSSCPEYQGPWIADNVLRYCEKVPVVEKTEYPLREAIQCALGGPQYVLTSLGTKFGYYVDHVAIMRKGWFPIAVNTSGETVINKLEDLKPLQDGQILIFLTIPGYGHIRNTDRLTGYWSLLMKQIEAEERHTVIPIFSRTWKKLSEPERIRYISQAIRLKCDELSAVVN
ncbi:uncharacterized protein LOC107036077 [Diachasma alloeum]|uniref:uncharacterized protein LOC107036077 n=1 Tax=Diachasma alloeum TaxID=454923 RepID=UPI0007384A6A|nr:uncharacterized protein LOC107036077 [Diachasma alloeum]